jgi:gliding motility-associated-like protein
MGKLGAQPCTTIGQTPSTAFPVCGTDTFIQASVPICESHLLAVPGCSSALASYADTNPYWYKFTCYTSGTLGFLITPNNLGDDYDWQLYDITGHNPNDVFTDPSLIVSGNWSGTYGLTGASAGGVNFIQCASDPAQNLPTFAQMPNLIQGHQYLLLVSHYTQTQSGYKLSFGGGTASITDPNKPRLVSATPNCDASQILVVLNKGMQCTSLAPDGSDFTIPSVPGSVASANGMQCTSGFDMDTLVVTLKNPLAPGNYNLVIQVGSDGNTLLDNCGNAIPAGNSLPFSIIPPAPTPMDSLAPVACAPSVLQLVFRKPIDCSSIAQDGSDFRISGPAGITVASASGTCVGGLTSTIQVYLSSPVVVGGNYQLTLVPGNDGNTLIDECGQQTPALSSVKFLTKDTVSAKFGYQILFGCTADTVNISYTPSGGVNQWSWNLDSQALSQALVPSLIFTAFGPKSLQHVVSNGFCSDTSTAVIPLNNALKAGILGPDEICPKDVANFQDSSTGNIVGWTWDFGDGSGSNQQNPPAHNYPNTLRETIYTVSLTVQNNLGCLDTAVKKMIRLQSCYITVPNAFTPNGDGKNDYLYPLNAYKARDLLFRVFNRYGQLVFETRDWTRKWDGTLNGKPQDSGSYVWMLEYTDGDSGKRFFLKGTSVLIR